jgi:hypothetical protein
MSYSYKRAATTIEAALKALESPSYDRTAAKKPVADKKTEKKPAKDDASKTDGAKKSEVTKAVKAILTAIDAVHDCAPNARDYQEEGEYDSKAYSKAVSDHGKRIDALHDILDDLNKLHTSKDA